jgi:hypothetical protein
MSPPDKFVGKIASGLGKFLLDHIGKAIGAAVALALVGAWTWTYTQFNPTFDYTAIPSSNKSEFVSLGQILNQIERDSHVSCNGGWSQRIGAFGLRKCYKFGFVPVSLYRVTVCSHDQRSHSISTSDQLAALRYFQSRFPAYECFRIASGNAENGYQIAPGKDLQFRKVQFANDPIEEHGFCGCSGSEINEIVRTMGGKLP